MRHKCDIIFGRDRTSHIVLFRRVKQMCWMQPDQFLCWNDEKAILGEGDYI